MSTELTYIIPLGKIARDGTTVTVTATPDECTALAGRMQIPAVHQLSCTFTLTPSPADPARIQASGRLHARVTYECIVSTDDFDAGVEEAFSVIFVPETDLDEDPDPDMDDEIPYRSDVIDLGEAAAEQLALALDPYPRIEGATVPDIDPDEDLNPFALLKARKPN